MAGHFKHEYPPNDELARRVEAAGFTAVAHELGVSPSTLRHHLVRQGLPTAKGETAPPGAESFTLTDIPESEWQPKRLLKAHGLDPDEWMVVRVRGSRWGKDDDPSAQLRVDAVPIKSQVHAPDISDWKPLPKPKARKLKKGDPLRAVVISDHHAPRHEQTFHRLFVQWLRDHQPDLIHVNGDLLDFPSVSRHRTEDDYNHDVNECLRAGYQILRDYRDACPDASITYLRGNHEERLRHYLHDNAPEAKDIRPAGSPDETPWHDLRRLLWLDQLHIDYIDQPWEHAKKALGRRLTARHGFSTSPNAGKIILDKLSGSTIQGHDHRLWMNLRTRHTADPDDPIEVRLAMSAGCACEIPGGLNYVNGGEPDWQGGAIAVDLYADDDFYCSPMVYVPGRLLTREGRYTA